MSLFYGFQRLLPPIGRSRVYFRRSLVDRRTAACRPGPCLRRRLCHSARENKADAGNLGAQAAGEAKKSGSGIPWGFMVFFAFVGSIGGYFWRSSRNNKLLGEAQSLILDVQALSAEEVELIRETNKMSPAHFKLISMLTRKKFASGKASPHSFFKFCASVGSGASDSLGSYYLFERLASRMEEKQKEYDIRILMCSILNAVESSVDERIELLFGTVCGSFQNDNERCLTPQEIVVAVEALLCTDQLPLRAMSRELTKYPYNEYKPSTPVFLATRAVQELLKTRTKQKSLKGYEKDAAEFFEQLLVADDDGAAGVAANSEQAADDNGKIDELYSSSFFSEKKWDMEDFTELVYSKALCAWGECEFAKKR